MRSSLFKILVVFLLPAFVAGAEIKSVWDNIEEQRTLLHWETLRGYRLFFHPDADDSFRRFLVVDVPSDTRVRSAWALIKPVQKNPRWGDDAWLRVEGVYEPGRLRFSWNGQYRNQEFDDKLYWFEVHVRKDNREPKDWKVMIYKSQNHPTFYKIGGHKTGKHPLDFVRGEYVSLKESGYYSKSIYQELPIIAKVMLPNLEGPFTIEGVQVAARFVADLEGNRPFNKQEWNCVCQQTIPEDSSARKKRKSVRCLWNIRDLKPGVYDLKLSLWHKMNHPARIDSCDVPELDADFIRLVIQP